MEKVEIFDVDKFAKTYYPSTHYKIPDRKVARNVRFHRLTASERKKGELPYFITL